METIINFDDYISDEEKRDIIRSVFENYARKQIIEQHERIFSNAAYEICFKLVQDAFDGNVEEIIVENTKKVISELSSHTVFRRKDAWEKEQSKGFELLNQVIEEQKPALQNRVRDLIDEIQGYELKEQVHDAICEIAEKKIFGGNDE